MTPVRIPANETGRTTRRVVCHFDARQAGAAPRTLRGTAVSASSVATMTTGSVSSASVRDAQRIPEVPKVGGDQGCRFPNTEV